MPERELGGQYLVRRVPGKGELKWKNERIFISEIFACEPLGCGLWMNAMRKCASVRFCWAGWMDLDMYFIAV